MSAKYSSNILWPMMHAPAPVSAVAEHSLGSVSLVETVMPTVADSLFILMTATGFFSKCNFMMAWAPPPGCRHAAAVCPGLPQLSHGDL